MDIFLIRLLQFMLAIGLLVLLHEGGHFFFAKLFGIRVEKFYLFFDPSIWKWDGSLFKIKPKNSDTQYGVGWLPLGGYCKIAGMIDESFDTEQMKQPMQPWEFRSKPAWQRLLVMIGGVLVNFLLALFIYSMILFYWGDTYIPTKNMTLGMKFNTEAKQYGFKDGDILVGTENGEFKDFSADMYRALSEATRADIIRDGKAMSIKLPGDINLLTQYRNSQNGTFKKVKEEGWQNSLYFQYDYNLPNATWNGFNRHFAFGRRWMYGKTYKIGMGLGLDWNRFVSNDKDSDFHPFHDQIMLRSMQLRGELMQRFAIRLWGINWDLGGYGGINITRRVRITDKTYITDDMGQPISDNDYSKKITTYYNAKIMNLFEYGAFTRISYSIANMLNIGVYGSYRLSPVCKDTDDLIHPDGDCYISPSHWSVGIEFEILP